MPYRKFDKYGIVKRLAAGGISEIFLAREDQGRGLLDRHVVIKKLLPQFAGNERLAAIIQREAKLLAALYHANIVQVYDAGITEEGEPYLVLEYIQGQDLRAIFQVMRDGRSQLEPAMVYYILEQVLRALVHMHELRDPKGRPYHLVHRDLSPTNIMCSMSGDVKLLDFGLARRALDVTGAGNLTGKLPYLSPEQLSGERIDARSDLFALGTVFYELCTGRFRYDGDSDTEIIRAIRERHDIPLLKAARHHPPELLALIARACEYEPSRRPASAREMLEDLAKLPAVVPFLHGGRSELVDFMEFHFGATRIDTTLPVDVSPEKPVSVRSFNIASLDLPEVGEIQQESILQETIPGKKALPKPLPPEDWFEPLSADPAPGGAPVPPPPVKPQDSEDLTRQGWKMPPSPSLPDPSSDRNGQDVTRQGWKMPPSPENVPPFPPPPPAGILPGPLPGRPPGPLPDVSRQRPPTGPLYPPPGPPPGPLPDVSRQRPPAGPLYPPPGPPPGPLPDVSRQRPPAGPLYPPPGPLPDVSRQRPPVGPLYPPPGPLPAARYPSAMPPWGPPPGPPPAGAPPYASVSESTVPVPPLAFDMFNDETHCLPAEKMPPHVRSSEWFSHGVLRVVFPAVGAVLLLVAAWMLLRPSSSAPQKALITLEGNAPQATAYLDNAPLGTLPVTFSFPQDGKPHEIRVEAPRKVPWRKTLHPSSIQTGTLRVDMQALMAEIKLFSTTAGVEVRILSERLNSPQEWLPLPLLLSDLEPGSTIRVEARLKKKTWETQIRVPETSYQEIPVEPPSRQ